MGPFTFHLQRKKCEQVIPHFATNSQIHFLCTDGTMVHLKKLNPTRAQNFNIFVCGWAGLPSHKIIASKHLFEVDCPDCIDIVISKRIKEIELLNKAKEKHTSVSRAFTKVPDIVEVTIRS
jgi:hypothetical protein